MWQQRNLQVGLILSRPSSGLPRLFMLRFAWNVVFTFLQLTHMQDSTALRNKVDNLLSHITTLGQLFATFPGDVAEQRCRTELIWYAVIPSFDSVLSSSQQA